MKKQKLVIVLLVLGALMVLVGTASATPPTDVSGEYTLEYYNLVTWEKGNNCFIEVDGTYPFTGDLVGVATTHFNAISHGTCDTACLFCNRETLHGTGTFVGEVLGVQGSFDYFYEGRGLPVDPGEDALDARFHVISGYDGLESLHGMLEADYLLGNDYDTYTGRMHLDPDNG